MPTFQSSGIPRIERLRSETSWIRALAGAARWDRPVRAPLSPSIDQPGRFAQGPEENCGRSGLASGRVVTGILGSVA